MKFGKMGKKTGSYKVMDMYLLRLTSLVVCRGRHSDKATELVNLIQSKFEPGRRHSIYYENVHFIRALRFLFYFNIILPRKFL